MRLLFLFEKEILSWSHSETGPIHVLAVLVSSVLLIA